MAAALLEEGSFQNTGPCSIEAFFSRFEFDVDPVGPFFWGYQVAIRVKVFALVKSLLGVAGETSDRRVPLINARRAGPLMGMWTNSRKAFGPTCGASAPHLFVPCTVPLVNACGL
jgi:hypothetical protein